MDTLRNVDHKEPEIVYSRSVKAGKRIYYLDVKKARNSDLYLCLTESKRRLSQEDEIPQFEKHKIFIYKEDFNHFTESLNDVIKFIRERVGEITDREEWEQNNTRDENKEDVSVLNSDDEQLQDQAELSVEEEKKETEVKKPRRGLFGLGRK